MIKTTEMSAKAEKTFNDLLSRTGDAYYARAQRNVYDTLQLSRLSLIATFGEEPSFAATIEVAKLVFNRVDEG